jgi:hypothetical protein
MLERTFNSSLLASIRSQTERSTAVRHLIDNKGIWLPFVDAYRTFRVAPGPEHKELLQGIQRLTFPESISIR